MKKKIAIGILLTFFLTGMLTLAFNIQPAKAQPITIYVDDDNVVGPWDGTPEYPYQNVTNGLEHASEEDTIFVYNGTYYENVVVNKTASLVGENRETTIIDGKGTGDVVTIISNGSSLSNFTLQSSGFFGSALRLENASGTTIVNNALTNSFYSLVLTFSDSNTIMDNDIAPGSYYSIFYNSSHNRLTRKSIGGLRFSGSFNNTLTENAIEAFLLDSSPNTKLRNTNLSYLQVSGETFSHFIQDIDSLNTINGKPIYYWVNHENAEVPSDAGYVALINCANITVRGLNFENNFQSIVMFSTNDSWILNNNVTNINEGIWIFSSSNNTISENTMANNSIGIQLLNECSNNNIHGNNITINGLGIWLVRSSNNRIFHNNFFSNVNQVNSYKSTNTWDDGYPSGGNYWSSYISADADGDGVGDTLHPIDENNTDRYPLIAPITVFDAGVWNGVAYNVDVVSNSTVSDFAFNPDEGTFLRFNVTGENGTTGFCRVTIPTDLLWVDDGWTITVGDQLITDYTIISNGNHTYLYFTYNHSTQTVIIQRTHAIPEFPSALIQTLFMVLSIITIIFTNKKRKNKGATSKVPFL